MQHWQKDSDLAGIRDKDAWPSCQPRIARPLPGCGDDVAALLKKAEQKKKNCGSPSRESPGGPRNPCNRARAPYLRACVGPTHEWH